MHESKMYKFNVFLTLTYSDEALAEDQSLNKEHHQLFMKRLRYKYAQKTIRYYHCGEYGDTTFRPHYHSIIFNLDFEDKTFHGRSKSGEPVYISRELDGLWSYGDCYIGEVTFESAAYCARYCVKKLTGPAKSAYAGKQEEYSTCSRNPPIGASWLQKWQGDVYPLDACVHKGKKLRVPRAYDRFIEKLEKPKGIWQSHESGDFEQFYPSLERSPMEKLKGKRARKAALHKEDQTRDRLDVIEELTQLRVDRLARSLK
jgi:hypothetical protein